ncbi:hypothetical protein FRC02_006986, partial [Tulasnella sp. 418]
KLYGVTYKPEDADKDYTNVLYYNYGSWSSEIVCHQCTLGIYKEIKEHIPDTKAFRLECEWNAQCGANFIPKPPLISPLHPRLWLKMIRGTKKMGCHHFMPGSLV